MLSTSRPTDEHRSYDPYFYICKDSVEIDRFRDYSKGKTVVLRMPNLKIDRPRHCILALVIEVCSKCNECKLDVNLIVMYHMHVFKKLRRDG